MTKTICDICGKDMPIEKFAGTIRDLNFCISSYGKVWDICAECLVDLNRWMTKRRAESEQEPCEVSEYDKDHIWYKGKQYISLRRFLEVKAVTQQEPDPCDFCSTIYPDADTKDIVFGREKYSDVHVESFITIDNEGNYHVNIDPGDPYELGYLPHIKFCPYCGRKLSEKEDKSCSNCKYWRLDKNDENRRCKYCFEMDEWVAESEENK